MRRTLSLHTIPVLALILTGCASSDKTYPSLAIRDAERVSGTYAVAEPIVAAPLSTETAGQLGTIRAQAAQSHRAFLAAAPAARQAVASGAGAKVASNSWASAQIALSDLDSLRSQTAVALSDLDLLFVDTTLAFERRQAVAEARAEVTELVSQQDRTLAELRGRLLQ